MRPRARQQPQLKIAKTCLVATFVRFLLWLPYVIHLVRLSVRQATGYAPLGDVSILIVVHKLKTDVMAAIDFRVFRHFAFWFWNTYPVRGLPVNFRKKCGEIPRQKKIIFTAYFYFNTALGKNSANSNAKFCKVNAKLCRIYAKLNSWIWSSYWASSNQLFLNPSILFYFLIK